MYRLRLLLLLTALAVAPVISPAQTVAPGSDTGKAPDGLPSGDPGSRTGPGSWTRLSAGTGPGGWYFSHAAVERSGAGRIWHTWNGGTWLYDPKANQWERVAKANDVGWRENFGSDHDSDNDVIWIGPQTSKPGPFDGGVAFDLATSQYRAAPSACSGDSIHVWDQTRKLLYCFAGWTTRGLSARSTKPEGSWAPKNPAGTLRAMTQDGARVSMLRGGIDSRTGALWYLGDNQELFVYDPGKNAWASVATTGQRPPEQTVFTLHEAANTIVGFAGCGQMVDPCATRLAQTYLLDLATNAWRLGPSGPAAPTALVMVRYIALYDRVRNRALLMAAGNGSELWEWRPGAGAAARSSPSPASPLAAGAPAQPTPESRPPAPSASDASRPPAPPAAETSRAPAAAAAPSSPAAAAPRETAPSATAQAGAPATPAAPAAAPPKSSGPVSPGKCEPVARQWVACPLPPATANAAPFAAGGETKDVNWTYDPLRKCLVMGTGDFTWVGAAQSGNPSIFCYTVGANSWQTLSPYGHPAGQVTPNHPSDRGPMIVDRAGTLWLGNAVPFPDQEGQASPGGSIYRSGLLRMDTAGVWTQVRPRGWTNSLANGHYDSAADAMLHFDQGGPCSGNPGTLKVTKLATLAQEAHPLCLQPDPRWSSGAGGWVSPQQPERSFTAWDDAARRLYVVARQIRYDPAGNIAEERASLFEFDRTTNKWRLRRPAPVKAGVPISPYSLFTVWDSVSKRLLFPVVSDPCGLVHQFLAYDPQTDAWEELPLPAGGVHGNMAAFDPEANAMVLAGSVFCSNYRQQHLYLWRYGG